MHSLARSTIFTCYCRYVNFKRIADIKLNAQETTYSAKEAKTALKYFNASCLFLTSKTGILYFLQTFEISVIIAIIFKVMGKVWNDEYGGQNMSGSSPFMDVHNILLCIQYFLCFT